MDSSERASIRLSDRILSALELAVDQGDASIAETLTQALDKAMTRSSGGEEFVERRDYPPEMEAVLEKFSTLK